VYGLECAQFAGLILYKAIDLALAFLRLFYVTVPVCFSFLLLVWFWFSTVLYDWLGNDLFLCLNWVIQCHHVFLSMVVVSVGCPSDLWVCVSCIYSQKGTVWSDWCWKFC